MDDLFERFVKKKTFLLNVTPKRAAPNSWKLRLRAPLHALARLQWSEPYT